MDDSILKEISRIYDAAVDPNRWPAFLEQFSRRYPGSRSYLWIEDIDRQAVSGMYLHNEVPEFVQSYTEHYAAVNPWTEVALRRPSGDCHTGDMLVPRKRYHASEFYNDWVAKQDGDHGIGANLFNNDRYSVFFSGILEKGFVPDDSDLATLRILVPHIQRAMQIFFQIAEQALNNSALESLLEVTKCACAVVNERGAVTFANRAAEKIFAAEDGLTVSNGCVGASYSASATALRAQLNNAFQTIKSGQLTRPLAVTIARPSGKPGYKIYLLPMLKGSILDEQARSIGVQNHYVGMFVSDPERYPLPDKQALLASYPISGAEARFVSQFLKTPNVREAAEHLGVTLETARTYLKSALSKLGVRNQAALVRKILTDLRHYQGS